MNSGTAALHLALLGFGIGPGDEVILPSYVCVAPLHAVEYVGATPRLADIDPATYNLDPADVRRRCTRHTRAIIVPHLFGLPADLDALLRLGIPVIEDCAQAFGARYRAPRRDLRHGQRPVVLRHQTLDHRRGGHGAQPGPAPPGPHAGSARLR